MCLGLTRLIVINCESYLMVEHGSAQSYVPCISSSAVNTVITVTTTANGTATAVSVNSWGY